MCFFASDMSTALQAEWDGGFIVLSYFIACLGSMLSLELMKQRTGTKGKRNILLLLGGAISLGTIGIWSMHFIGMMALRLTGEPINGVRPKVPIGYSASLTVMSLIIGAIIVKAGFVIAGDPNKPKWWKNLLAGTAGGLGVSAMHYTGMIAMVGVDTRWNAEIIILSIFIGIFAATVAMFIFFRFGHLWARNLKLQLITSCIMGIAVCGMHYTGMQAATFYPPSTPIDVSKYANRNELLAVILPLVGGTVTFFVAIRLKFRHLLQQELNKRYCLTLNIAIIRYDPEIPVSSNNISALQMYVNVAGAPPSCVIERHLLPTIQFSQHSIDFLRMLRCSYEWNSMHAYLNHLQNTFISTKSKDYSVSSLKLFSQFVGAADELSKQLNVPLQMLGPIFWKPNNSVVTIVCQIHSKDVSSAKIPQIIKVDSSFEQLLVQSNSGFSFRSIVDIKNELHEYLHLDDDISVNNWINELQEYYAKVNIAINPVYSPSYHLLQVLVKAGIDVGMSAHTAEDLATNWFDILDGDYQLPQSSLSAACSSSEPVLPKPVRCINDLVCLQKQAAWNMIPLPVKLKQKLVQNIQSMQIQHQQHHLLAPITIGSDGADWNVCVTLLYSSVSARGLQVMIPTNGPFSMPPFSMMTGKFTREEVRQLIRDILKLRASLALVENENSDNVCTNALIMRRILQIQNNQASISRRTLSGNKALKSAILQNAFLTACSKLMTIVGKSSDLRLSLLHPSLVRISPHLSMLVFVQCRMSAILPDGYTLRNTLVPLPLFEIMHRAAIMRTVEPDFDYVRNVVQGYTKWIRHLLSEQLSRKSPLVSTITPNNEIETVSKIETIHQHENEAHLLKRTETSNDCIININSEIIPGTVMESEPIQSN